MERLIVESVASTGLTTRANRQPQLGNSVDTPLHRHPLRHHVRITLAVLIIVTQVPFLFTIWNSLFRWNLTAPNDKQFIGFQNYLQVFQIPAFFPALVNSVVMTVGTVLCSVIIGLVFAISVNRKFRSRGLARTLLFIPFLVPAAAAALMWKNEILNPTYGLLNYLLGLIGVGPIDFVNEYPMMSVIAVAAWQWIPFSMIILLAGLQSQSASAREAAMIDGASDWQSFWHITLPHLRPYIEIAALLSSIFTAQLIDPIVLMTQGGPGLATTTLPYLLYNTAFRGFDVGLSSAMGVIVVAGTIFIVLLILKTSVSVFKGDAR